MSIDTTYIRGLLDISEYAPHFTGTVTKRADHLFADAECDECTQSAAVYVEYGVDDPDEGIIATDATLCAEHSRDGLICILDREDRDEDSGVEVTLNYWAARYGAFLKPSIKAAA